MKSLSLEYIADMLFQINVYDKTRHNDHLIVRLLDFLHEKGIKVAVATATDPKRAKEYLSQIGIYDKFDKVCCATMVKNGKPEPDVYLYACEQIGEKPEDCVAVEDSPNGIRSAYRAGLKVIMVPDLTGPDEEVNGMLTACVNNLSELKALIQQ